MDRFLAFQDSNGRIFRLLMAHAYARVGEFPSAIPALNRMAYIDGLELADGGNFMAFVNYLGGNPG